MPGDPLTRQALKEGLVDVALMFTTDPAIETARDSSSSTTTVGLQPAESITPLVRKEIVDRWGPGVVDVIDAVSARLTTECRPRSQRSVGPGRHQRRCSRRRMVGEVQTMTTDAESDPVTDTMVALADSTPHVPPTVRRTRRLRRPSGAPPPLPRHIGRSGRGWIVALIVLVVWMIVTVVSLRARRRHRPGRRRDPADDGPMAHGLAARRWPVPPTALRRDGRCSSSPSP